MNDSFMSTLQLEPGLQQALERYKDFLTAASGDVQLLMNSFNPLKSMQQISQASLAFYAGLDWMKVAQNALKPDSFLNYFNSLQEIQNAAASQLSAGQESLVSTVVKDSQAFTSRLSEVKSAQQLLADTINSGLDTYADVKTNLTQQSQTLAGIHSSLVAFQQQSLSELSGEAVA
jgi:hypothetical protein